MSSTGFYVTCNDGDMLSSPTDLAYGVGSLSDVNCVDVISKDSRDLFQVVKKGEIAQWGTCPKNIIMVNLHKLRY